MGRITEKDHKAIVQLVADCDMYNLSEKEALEYIRQRLGKEISGRTYRRYSKNLNNDESIQKWVHQHIKVGFLTKHKKIIDVVDTIQKDTLRDYMIENSKPYEQKNHMRIQKYRDSLRENSKMLQELTLGSPIVAQIKAQLEQYKSEPNEFRLQD